MQWLFFEQYSHEPHIAFPRFWALFGIDVSEEERSEKLRWGGFALRGMDNHLKERTFMVGERYTIADIALYAYTHVAHEGGFDLSRFPALGPWLERVAAQPGHIPIDA